MSQPDSKEQNNSINTPVGNYFFNLQTFLVSKIEKRGSK
jgi:hypothetical protein